MKKYIWILCIAIMVVSCNKTENSKGTVEEKYTLSHVVSKLIAKEGDTLYYHDPLGTIYKEHLDTGTVFWEYQTGQRVISDFYITENELYYSGLKNLKVLDKKNGQLKNEIKKEENIKTLGLYEVDSTVVGTHLNGVYNFSPTNKTIHWELGAYSATSAPKIQAYADEQILLVGGVGDSLDLAKDHLLSLDPASGDIIWDFQFDLGLISQINTDAEGNIYFANDWSFVNTSLFCLNKEGELIWKAKHQINPGLKVLVYEDLLFLNQKNKVNIINRLDGTLEEEIIFPSRFYKPRFIFNEKLFVSSDTDLVVYDIESKENTIYKNVLVQGPWLAEGKIYMSYGKRLRQFTF